MNFFTVTSYLKNHIQHTNYVMIVKTVSLCVVSIRRKQFLKFGKHGNVVNIVSACYGECHHLYQLPENSNTNFDTLHRKTCKNHIILPSFYLLNLILLTAHTSRKRGHLDGRLSAIIVHLNCFFFCLI